MWIAAPKHLLRMLVLGGERSSSNVKSGYVEGSRSEKCQVVSS